MTADHPTDPKALSQAQFGANAANYATSSVHAKGASLARMVDVVSPQSNWLGLDIATAAGHTAFEFAPHIATMVATDLTIEMVALARDRAAELDHRNVSVAQADSENLPFRTSSLDLVTCRIAPHHFPRPDAFVAEVARVLQPGGVFAMVDNIVPDDPNAADWYNDWERRRDPSHAQCLGLSEWQGLIHAAGMSVRAAETAPKRMDFMAWCNNMSVPDAIRVGLLRDLHDATPAVQAFLLPDGTDEETAEFTLTEGLIVATRP